MTGNKTQTIKKFVNLHDVPDEKFSVMLQKTVLGVLFAGLGVWGLLHEWNHYLGIGMVLLGATVWSGQVVTNALMSLLRPFKAWKAAKDE